jgi:hypothetical protein
MRKFEVACVASIHETGRNPRNWAANAWLLERKFPQRYGKVDSMSLPSSRLHGTTVPSPVKRDNSISSLTEEQHLSHPNRRR